MRQKSSVGCLTCEHMMMQQQGPVLWRLRDCISAVAIKKPKYNQHNDRRQHRLATLGIHVSSTRQAERRKKIFYKLDLYLGFWFNPDHICMKFTGFTEYYQA